jgi:hypothetical protein
MQASSGDDSWIRSRRGSFARNVLAPSQRASASLVPGGDRFQLDSARSDRLFKSSARSCALSLVPRRPNACRSPIRPPDLLQADIASDPICIVTNVVEAGTSTSTSRCHASASESNGRKRSASRPQRHWPRPLAPPKRSKTDLAVRPAATQSSGQNRSDAGAEPKGITSGVLIEIERPRCGE